jgi:outer membrane immunogenic protein
MKHMIRMTAAAALLAGAAQAGTLEIPVVEVVPPAAPPLSIWNGPYAGVLVSPGMSGEYEGSTFIPLDGPFAFGVFGGYNINPNGPLVFGGEVAYWPTLGDPFGFQDGDELTNLIDLRARVGFAVGNALVYGAAGWSMGNWYDDFFGDDFSMSGLNYGGGVDMMISDRIFVGAEYVIREMSGETGGNTVDLNFDMIQIRAGFQF